MLRFLRRRLSITLILGLAAGSGLLAPTPTTGQDAPDAVAEQPLAMPPAEQRKAIEQRLASLDASVLGESDFRKVNEYYQLALSALSELEQHQAELASYQNKIEQYPDELQDFQQKLQDFPAEPTPLDFTAKLDALQSQQQELERQVQATRDLLAQSESQPKARSARLTELPKLMLEAQQQLDETTNKLEALPTDETNLAVTAERTALEARLDALKVSLNAMDKQRAYYQISGELVQARRDFRSKTLARDEKKLTAIRDLVGKRRMRDAKQQANEAAQAARVERPEAIAKLAENNSELAQNQAEIVAEIDKAETLLADFNTQLDEIKQQHTRSEERIEASGMNESIGLQLRQQQEQLPNTRELRSRIAEHRRKKSDIAYRLYELHDRRSATVDVDLETQVSEVLKQLPASNSEDASKEVRELLVAEREILDSMIENYEKYSNQLTSLIAVGTRLVGETAEYANFITRNVLWIRSCTVPSQSDLEPATGALKWSLNPNHWQEAATAFWRRVMRSPTTSIIVLGTIAGLIYLQEKLRRTLRDIGTKAEKRSCTNFALSLQAAMVTLLLALPWPALLWFVGWWLDGTINQTAFTLTLSRGMRLTSMYLLLLEMVRHVCRTKGLAESHFNWPKSCVAQMRRSMRILLFIGLPLVLWLAGLEIQSEQRLWSPTLGRLCFVILMLLFGWVSYRLLLNKRSAIRQSLLQRAQTTRFSISAWIIPIVALLPLALAGLAISGYYYTAQQLTVRLLVTAALAGVLLVLGGLTRRWILLNRRRLAREQARQKRAAALAAAKASGETLPAVESTDETIDLVALGEQTNRLIQTLLVVAGVVVAWLVWGEMLPALSLIGDQSIPGFVLKWGELIRFLLVICVTYIAVGNVPALLEFSVLQHLPLEAGIRYAITSLCRYVLVAIGMYLAYTSLGFDSTSIQWLVAAMGVGLGFGLQEIFANFVSGIILLFEQPIRVGDLVTIGDKTGSVARIRMRATTIVDWDRKEYIVPNKDLVTERLLNWTLSDQTNRIVIQVGVAYGSDTELACRLLLEVVRENPLLMDDPAPSAVFDGFGDSTLNLTLRCFLPNLDNRLDTIHNLHTAIDKKFKAAGLEIAFPQLDLHLQSVPPELGETAASLAGKSGSNGTTG